MNPWHDGWKLHKLKGSVLAHFQLRVLSRAIALVRAAVVGAGGDGPAVGQALDKLRASTARGAEALAQAGLPKPGPDCPRAQLLERVHVAGKIGGRTDDHDRKRGKDADEDHERKPRHQ